MTSMRIFKTLNGLASTMTNAPYMIPWTGYSMADSAYWFNVFSKDEAKAIIDACMADDSLIRQGHVGGTVNTTMRNNKARWVYPHNEDIADLIFPRIATIAGKLNARYFRKSFDHLGFYEGVQFAMYRPGEHYAKTHHDRLSDMNNAYAQRVLSLSVQLSDPDDYDGGELILNPDGAERVAGKDLGTMTMFPSFIQHRVSPVTRGTRYALIAWIGGED